MSSSKHQTITDKALEQIQANQVTIRPRWHFVALGLVASLALGLLTIMVVFLINLSAFRLRGMHGAQSAQGYTTSGFPWLALVAGIVSLGLLVWLVRRFDFSYRLGRWVVAGVLLACVVVGVALAYTNLDYHLENYGPLRGFYGQHMNSGQQSGDDGTMMRQQRGKQ